MGVFLDTKAVLDTVGYGWVCFHKFLDTVGYGEHFFWIRPHFWIWLDTVGYGWIQLDTVGYVWIRQFFLTSIVGYGWIRLDTLRYTLSTQLCNSCVRLDADDVIVPHVMLQQHAGA